MSFHDRGSVFYHTSRLGLMKRRFDDQESVAAVLVDFSREGFSQRVRAEPAVIFEPGASETVFHDVVGHRVPDRPHSPGRVALPAGKQRPVPVTFVAKGFVFITPEDETGRAIRCEFSAT
jgi:hypothetical protein